MRAPSILRYVECELPDEVERTIAAFEDDFDNRLKPFYDRLEDIVVNDLPAVEAELESQIALREELLKGSPVQSLASLEALDASINLTSPKRDDNDPETVRIDERKLGAAGICLLNGRMLKIEKGGNRLAALRHLWEVASGDYNYFLRLGTAVYTSPASSYTLFEYNQSTPSKLAFVNKGFTFLESVGYKNSQFTHRMVWTSSVSASFALKSKMALLGYDSTQINNTFSGLNPNVDFDYLGTISGINTLIRAVTRLIFLPTTDSIRQPPWENEANYIELAIKRFLTYRTKKYTTSSTFDIDFWPLFLKELRPKDIKELLENRPEITDVALPQDMDAITTLVEKAVAVPSETTLINTYMNNLPIGKNEEINLTTTLYDLGLAIHNQVKAIGNTTRAAQLEQVLIELLGGLPPTDSTQANGLRDFINPSIMINPADLAALFPTTNIPPIGELTAAIQSSGNEHLINAALSANSATKAFNLAESKTIKKEGLLSESGSTTNNVPSGTTQGFPSVETFAMILTRRIQWGANFTDCSGEQAVGKSSSTSPQEMTTVSEFSKDKSVTNNEEWRQFNDDMAYLSIRLNVSGSASISDIRGKLEAYIKYGVSKGYIAKGDTHLASQLGVVYKSNDIKMVASTTVSILKSIPIKGTVTTPDSPQLYSETGADRGAAMYAAMNRNQVEDQGGKIPQNNSDNTADVKGDLEAIGIPALGVGIVGGSASVNADLQICPTKALTALDNYLKGLLTPPAWLMRLLNIIKHQIIMFQDRIDKFILTLQAAMDAIMAKLERLLTLDLNFSGKLGFENSLFKCSWGIDLGLKINLLDLLLMYLDRFLGVILGPILKLLGLLGDLINEIFCIPIRWIGTILNGAAYAAAELLAKIGCTVKDFKLPVEIFDILNLINGLFSLRSLVFKKGSADWLKMMGRLSKGANEFKGLSQFASVCANPNLSASISALQAASKLAISDIPLGVKNAVSTFI